MAALAAPVKNNNRSTRFPPLTAMTETVTAGGGSDTYSSSGSSGRGGGTYLKKKSKNPRPLPTHGFLAPLL